MLKSTASENNYRTQPNRRSQAGANSEAPLLDRVHGLLSSLSLSEADATLEAHLERAAVAPLSYAELLCELLESEVNTRHDRYLSTRLKLAHLPYQKTLEQFDFGFQPSIDERQIRELRTQRYVHDASNVILLGPPGVGKTHLSVGLAIESIKAGMSAYFITANEMIQNLSAAAREARLAKRLQVYVRPRVLIIDEMGYLPLDALGATLLFQLVSARYERGSIILTSNKSYGDWGSVFGDPVLATAILDRLLHHSSTINIRGESYRLKERRKAGLLSHPTAAMQAATIQAVEDSLREERRREDEPTLTTATAQAKHDEGKAPEGKAAGEEAGLTSSSGSRAWEGQP
jgi:DNA replication protein DnaC